MKGVLPLLFGNSLADDSWSFWNIPSSVLIFEQL